MPRRLAPPILIALVCLLAAGIAAPAAFALSRDAQTKQNLRLLKTYIDACAGRHGFEYPPAESVRRGGGLPAPLWPRNPWTGKAMAPGTGRGAYTYTVVPGGGYTLRGRLTSGHYTLTGAAPDWLDAERTSAATDLAAARAAEAAAQAAEAAALAQLADARSALAAAQAELSAVQAELSAAQAELSATQAELSAAQAELSTTQAELSAAQAERDVARGELDTARALQAELGGRILKGYVEQYGMLHNGWPPRWEDLRETRDVGLWFPYWPDNPYTGAPMEPGPDPGDFDYAVLTGGAYWLTVCRSPSSWTDLSGTVPQQLKDALGAARSNATNVSIEAIQAAVDRYAMDHNGTYPAVTEVSSTALASYVDFWPQNPWTGDPMANQAAQGDFTYTLAPDHTDYQLTARIEGGVAGAVVDDTYADHILGMRDRYKNAYCQAAVQALREYVEEWKGTHAGVPPATDQMISGDAAVGALHAWWPVNPWTGGAMANADTKGDFQYAAGGDGSYTLTVRQAPLAPYDEYYTPH